MKPKSHFQLIAAIAAAALAYACQGAHAAGTTSSAQVSSVSVFESGYISTILTVAANTPPGCSGSNVRYVDNVNGLSGRMQFAALELAMLSARSVNITGTGSCSTIPGTSTTAETISYIRINPS